MHVISVHTPGPEIWIDRGSSSPGHHLENLKELIKEPAERKSGVSNDREGPKKRCLKQLI